VISNKFLKIISSEENRDMGQWVERRKSFRFPLNTKVFCHINEKVYHGTVRDLSITGLYMNTTENPPTSSICDLEIVLQGDHSCLTIHEVAGVVLRRDEAGVGIKFNQRLEWVALLPICFHKMQEHALESTEDSVSH
jgi:hypothetical protein